MKKLWVTLFSSLFITTGLEASTTVTGLPLPRFASLRSAEVNLRVGPSTHYPTSWIVKRRALPVKVIAEHGNWRKIQLHDDTVGWVFQSMLTGNKTILVKNASVHLRSKPDKQGRVIAHLHKDVIGQLKQCKEGWCKTKFDSYSGFVPQTALWGAEFEKK